MRSNAVHDGGGREGVIMFACVRSVSRLVYVAAQYRVVATVAGTFSSDYFFCQAAAQYLDREGEDADVAVMGDTNGILRHIITVHRHFCQKYGVQVQGDNGGAAATLYASRSGVQPCLWSLYMTW